MIGRVLTALDETAMSEDTLLIFTSDNGPVWYEHDVERYAHDSAGGLRGMKADAWEAGHRMPFIVRWPGKVEKNSVSGQLVCFTDLLATLAAVTGYPRQADEGQDSFDFSSVFLKQPTSTPLRSSLAMQAGNGMRTIRSGQWKLIEGLGSGGFSEPKRVTAQVGEPGVQLYNLRDDLGESTNLATANPEIVERLQAELREIAQ